MDRHLPRSRRRNRSSRPGLAALAGRDRHRCAPGLERLEARQVLAGAGAGAGAFAIAPLLPLHQGGAALYSIAQPGLPAAEVTGVYRAAFGVDPTPATAATWVGALQSGTSGTDDLALAAFRSRAYYAQQVDLTYQNLLGRPADDRGASVWVQRLEAGTSPVTVLAQIAGGAEYRQLHRGHADFVQSLYQTVLGRTGGPAEIAGWVRALNRGASRTAVAARIAGSEESMGRTITAIYATFFGRSPEPAALQSWVAATRRQPLNSVLAQILGAPEFQFRAAAGLAGAKLPSFSPLQRQGLARDPVVAGAVETDSTTASFSTLATTTSDVPLDSPWGDAVAFPAVGYAQAATGAATVPTVSFPLPGGLVTLQEGFTIQTWFQARGPGALVSLPITETTTNTTFEVPLIAVNAQGNLVAGLFDPTPLNVVPYQTLLSWVPPATGPATPATQVGAAHPLVSQTTVLDGTWHHVALVATDQAQFLYLDGVLQGGLEPLYRQVNTGLTTSTGSLAVALDQAPSGTQVITGSIWQANPSSQTTGGKATFGSGSAQLYAYTVTLENGQVVDTSLTSTLADTDPGWTNTTTVTGITYNPGSGSSAGSLTFSIGGGSLTQANALSVAVNYATPSGAYALTPAAGSTWSTPVTGSKAPAFATSNFSATTNFVLGGSLIPEPTSAPTPATNYPQGFLGALDEVAIWSFPLEAGEVQAAVGEPVSQTSLTGEGLVSYFDFNTTAAGPSWANVANDQAGTTTATGQGTVLPVSISTTIPTNPFDGVARLPGYRNFGLQLMTPLASPSVTLASGQAASYVVALAAGDQLGISLPEEPGGTLTVAIENDLGQTATANIAAGQPQYLVVARTGTLKLTLTWKDEQGSEATAATFTLLPGPLNNLAELLTSYADLTPSGTTTVYAYSDPNLPTVNPNAGTSKYAPAPASYWPEWTQSAYFPSSSSYTSSDLSAVYADLVAQATTSYQFTDFCNLIGQNTTNPATILGYLNGAYQALYGTPPTAPDGGQPFPVQAAATAQEAVYQFLYNANLMQQQVYTFLFGNGSSAASLSGWTSQVIASLEGASNIPQVIANTISSGQADQVQEVTTTVTEPSQKQSVGHIFESIGVILAASLLTAASVFVPGSTAAAAGLDAALVAGGITAAGAVGQGFVNNAMAPGASSQTITVPLTPITNSVLNYETLATMGSSINAGQLQAWSSFQASLNDTYAQSVLSNYGLLQALSTISPAALSTSSAGAVSSMAPDLAASSTLATASWQHMIPAEFTWAPVTVYAYPTADGRTPGMTASSAIDLQGGTGAVGVVTGDFDSDGNLDMVVSNSTSSTLSVLLGGGNHTFGTATTVDLNGGTDPQGIAAADFDGDGNLDLVVACRSSSTAMVLLGNGNGTFQTAQKISLQGGTDPQGIVTADFNNDGNADFVTANNGSSTLTLVLGNGNGTFGTGQTLDLNGGTGPGWITAGDLNGDGLLDLAVACNTSSSGGVLLNSSSKPGSFGTAIKIDLQGGTGAAGVAIGQFVGDTNPDVAFSNHNSSTLSLVPGNGNGTFGTATTVSLGGGTGPQQIVARSSPNNSYDDLIVACYGSSTVVVVYIGNDGTAQAGPEVNLQGATGASGVALGDFNGDGLSEIAVANTSNSTATLISGINAANFVTFTPGTGSLPSTGGAMLASLLSSSQLQTLLQQTLDLQGGNAVFVPAFDGTSAITPATSSPPAGLGNSAIVGSQPYQLQIPGYLLTLTPASLKQTQSGSTYEQAGAFLTAWNLYDSNNNPIALSTASALFGVPVPNPAAGPNAFTGAALDPVNPQSPLVGYNGAWLPLTQPVAGSAATWAEAFFTWGQGTPGYAPLTPVPTLPQTGTNSTYGQNYTLTFAPATDAPPSVATASVAQASSRPRAVTVTATPVPPRFPRS